GGPKRLNDAPRLGQADQLAHPKHLGGEHAPAKGRQLVVDAARIVLRGGPAGSRFDEVLLLEPPDVPVEVARLELHGASRVLEDVLADAIAMPVAGGEHHQNEAFDWTEWEQGVGLGVFAGHGLDDRVNSPIVYLTRRLAKRFGEQVPPALRAVGMTFPVETGQSRMGPAGLPGMRHADRY